MELQQENEFVKYIKNTEKAFTHGGKFHADDVFSYALVKIVNPDIQIVRGNFVPDDFTGLVFDIGGGEYDHHQKDSRVRENGVPYASLGLLWEQLGSAFFEEEKRVEKFDYHFVQPLDLNDNTGEPNEIAALIRDFNPVWDADENTDKAFLKAVDFASQILHNKLEYIYSNMRADVAMNAYMDKAHNHVLVMDAYVPWKKAVDGTDIEFVVFPSNRGGYCAMTVKDEILKEDKCDFISDWYGKRDEELAKISGIKTLRFCHKSGFMLTADALEDAVKACELSRENQKQTTIFSKKVRSFWKRKLHSHHGGRK